MKEGKKNKVLLITTVIVLCFGILAIIPALAGKAEGNPFQNIWNAISLTNARVAELEERITELELQEKSPDFDSGWRDDWSCSGDGCMLVIEHTLATNDNVFVYMIGRRNNGNIVHNKYYGGGIDKFSPEMPKGAYYEMDDTNINIYRESEYDTWEEVRVMIWEISSPP